jgi:glycosyltransferase involved in cell wall biosynthesis
VRLSVGICTWNRCELLRQTLEQMTRLRAPAGVTWEVVVVNNNCSDATDAVLAEFAAQLPLRRIFEATPGQSSARNAVVQAATGDYLIWTDDDVLVDPEWLVAYAGAFAARPDAVVFGGPITPWFEGTPPAWLAAAFHKVSNAYAVLDLGSEPISLGHDAYPFGANMAFRTDVLKGGAFDPTLGLRPGSSMRGEEMVLIRDLFAAGEQGWWVPEAHVQHFVPRERQTLAYLKNYYRGAGQLLARLDEDVPGIGRFLGRPLWLWRQAVESEFRFRFRRIWGNPVDWVEDLRGATTSWAQLRHYAPRPR